MLLIRNIKAVLILSAITALTSFSLHYTHYQPYFQKPSNFPEIVYDTSNNRLTKDGIELGKKLFYDTILSKTNAISCASCHKQEFAFSDAGSPLSKGIDGKTGSRNTPSIANLAWSNYFSWDGSVTSLDLQPVVPITNHVEMNETVDGVIAKLKSSIIYRQMFQKAFGSQEITIEKLMKALAQFLVTCVSADSKYDKVMRKEGAVFTKEESEGYQLFKQHCNSCHTEPMFTNYSFADNKIGSGIHKDEGRYSVTLKYEDKNLFKVASLRNVLLTPPYMHDGRFTSLDQVLMHYDNKLHKILPNSVSNNHQQKVFSEAERSSIISFLQTLTDSSFISNSSLR